jgi:hypothetical protein
MAVQPDAERGAAAIDELRALIDFRRDGTIRPRRRLARQLVTARQAGAAFDAERRDTAPTTT